ITTRCGLLLVLMAHGLAGAGSAARAEDGAKLWLRYTRLAADRPREIVVQGDSPTCAAIRDELSTAMKDLTGAAPVVVSSAAATEHDGGIVVGTPGNSALIRD